VIVCVIIVTGKKDVGKKKKKKVTREIASVVIASPPFSLCGSQPRACARADRATTLRAPALIDADRSGIGLFRG